MMEERRVMTWKLFETAIGWCGIAWNDVGLTWLQLPEQDRAATEAGAAPCVSLSVMPRRRFLPPRPLPGGP